MGISHFEYRIRKLAEVVYRYATVYFSHVDTDRIMTMSLVWIQLLNYLRNVIQAEIDGRDYIFCSFE